MLHMSVSGLPSIPAMFRHAQALPACAASLRWRYVTLPRARSDGFAFARLQVPHMCWHPPPLHPRGPHPFLRPIHNAWCRHVTHHWPQSAFACGHTSTGTCKRMMVQVVMENSPSSHLSTDLDEAHQQALRRRTGISARPPSQRRR